MYRVQFYPSKDLGNILNSEAQKKGVSVSKFVTDLLEDYYGLSRNTGLSITELTSIVLQEIEDYLKSCDENIRFDLNSASLTYRSIDMTCGKKPSTVRASIGRSFGRKIGKNPFVNVSKCIVNGKQVFSENNALVYEYKIQQKNEEIEDFDAEALEYYYDEILSDVPEEDKSEVNDYYDM